MTGSGARAEAAAEGTRGRPALRALGPAELARLRAEALHLLETGGVVVPGRLAGAVLADAGVPVEPATGVARIPARLVEEALALAPATPVLAGRLPERDVVLGQTGLLATGGPAAEVLSGGGERRPAGRDDLAEICRLADALPEVAVVAGPPLSPERGGSGADARPAAGRGGRSVLEDLEACLANTTRHVLLTTVESPSQGEAVAAMAAAVAGGTEALRRRPPVSLAALGTRPAGPAIDALLVAARHGLPVGFALELAAAAAEESSALGTPPRAARAGGGGRPRRLRRRAARRARGALHRLPRCGRPAAAGRRPRRHAVGLAAGAGVQ